MKKIRYLPFGYTIAKGEIRLQPQEAPIVQNVFKWYLEGYDTLKKREFDFWITEKDRRLAHPGMLSKAAGFLKFGGSYVSRSLQREIDLL